jgi:hypothetical protein
MSAARAATSPKAVAIHMKSVDCCKLAPLVVLLLLRPVHLAETKWVYPIFSTARLRVYFGSSLTLAYRGFSRGDAALARSGVSGLGVLYLIAGGTVAAMFLAPGYTFEDTAYVETLGFATFGAVNVLCARTLDHRREGIFRRFRSSHRTSLERSRREGKLLSGGRPSP